MASDEHKSLAEFLKNVHSTLRTSSATLGAEKAWTLHCEKADILKKYAECMRKLATTHWDPNCKEKRSLATSRIAWAADYCHDYFVKELYIVYNEKEMQIAQKINIPLTINTSFPKPLNLLDVGSCYNPFKLYSFFKVLAIDLCPADESVLKCDFLNFKISSNTLISNNKVIELEKSFFDIVTFCFVLEYIPSSALRLEACGRAYRLLKEGGLMIITTPDSKHVGANSKIMKCWRYSLACMGFSRIKYEKMPHMHCMVFRKSVHMDIARRWAFLHKEEYMEISLHIPQDFNVESKSSNKKTQEIDNDFTNMPFCNMLLENDL